MRFTKQLLLCGLLLLTLVPLKAQMAGTVTINSGAAATSVNFKNWFSFWNSLQGLARNDGGSPLSAGITAAVTVNVITDQVETSRIEFPAIVGASATKTITIVGNNRVLSYGGNYEVISFKGGDHFRISGLTIRHTGSQGARSTCMRFYNQSDSNVISNCTLEFSNLSIGKTNGSAYIAFAPNDSIFNAASSTLTGKSNLISNNVCRTTNTNSTGPSYGFAIIGSNSGYTNSAHNNTFSNNQIQNFYYTAVLNLYSNGNQFYNNDISRRNTSLNNCFTSIYGFVSSYTYGQNRSTLYRKNSLHDLPYQGCLASVGVNYFFGFNCTNNKGTSNYPFCIDSNRLQRMATYYSPQAGYFRDNDYPKVATNTVDSFFSYDNGSDVSIWEFRTGDELTFENNQILRCSLNAGSVRIVILDSMYGNKTGYSRIHRNTITKNSFFLDAYLILPNNGNYSIIGNTITWNTVDGNKGGYIYAIAGQDVENVLTTNNLIANNLGYDGFVGIYFICYNSGTYACRVWQNTIYSDGGKSPGAYDNNGIYLVPFYHSAIDMSGNLVQLLNAASGVVAGIECNDTLALDEWDNNTYHISNFSNEIWPTPLGWFYDFASYLGTGFMGSGEALMHPKFADPVNNDFRSLKWYIQNNVKSSSNNLYDINKVVRHTPLSDRGAIEVFSDLAAVKTSFTIPTSVCSGTEKTVDITIKNLFSDTLSSCWIAFSVNGVVQSREKVTKKILSGDSLKATFNKTLKLNQWGKARIAIYIDAGDDKAANDSFIFNTTVIPAPGGGKFTPSAIPTKTIYRTNQPSDICFVGENWIQTMNSPRLYSNSQYNTKWAASAWAVTVPGNQAVSTVTYTMPSGSADQEVSFKSNNTNLEDSTLKVCVKITDLGSGCDTITCRNMYVAPKATVDFSYPSLVCGADTAFFKNLSSIKSGGMQFFWTFGTGKSADTSNLADPAFVYAAPGTYKVKLAVKSLPYGFVTYDSANVVVKPNPLIAINRTNACFGDSVAFSNSSSPAGNAYLWKFGDGKTSTQKSPKHKYATTGTYTAWLIANLSGCVDSAKISAITFDKPKADFTYTSPTPCSNAPYTFAVKGPITWGSFAAYWTFNNTANSTSSSPTYTFGTAGSTPVKLILATAFGCKDSIVQFLTIKQAPQVGFNHTEACQIDSTVFQDITPPVSGTNFTYFWDFGDGSKSTAQNPWRKWPAIGIKNVKFRVVADNGCRDSLLKTLTVKPQAKPSFFDNSPVCSGSKVIFENKTTWTQGGISYNWDFADGAVGNVSDPVHTYNSKTTTTYNVTLCASIDNACKKCFIKPVTVNAIPLTCDFISEPDYAFGYYGMKLTPKDANTGNIGPESGVNYVWTIQNTGTVKSPVAQFNFQTDGKYLATMCAEVTSNSNCSCCITKEVVMDRAHTQALNKSDIRVFPNPTTGVFYIDLPKESENCVVRLIQTSGAEVYHTVVSGKRLQIQPNGISRGIYLLEVSTKEVVHRSLIELMD